MSNMSREEAEKTLERLLQCSRVQETQRRELKSASNVLWEFQNIKEQLITALCGEGHIGEGNEMVGFEFYAPVRQDNGPIESNVEIDNARLTKAECIVNAEYEYFHWTVKPRIVRFRATEIKEG